MKTDPGIAGCRNRKMPRLRNTHCGLFLCVCAGFHSRTPPNRESRTSRIQIHPSPAEQHRALQATSARGGNRSRFFPSSQKQSTNTHGGPKGARSPKGGVSGRPKGRRSGRVYNLILKKRERKKKIKPRRSPALVVGNFLLFHSQRGINHWMLCVSTQGFFCL